MSETFIKERPLAAEMTGLSAKASKDAPKGEVTVDDATLFLARFVSGALGSFEATRFAAGHRSTNSFEINGSLGSVKFDFERMNELEVYLTSDDEDVQGFRRVLATDPAHDYAEARRAAGPYHRVRAYVYPRDAGALHRHCGRTPAGAKLP